MKGGPEAYKAIAPQVDFTKRQFANAKTTLNEGVAPGGARERGYRQIAQGQASTISNLFRDKINEIVARLAAFSTGNTQSGITATGGISNAGTALGELAAARGNAVAAGIGGVAGALGTFAGLKAG